MTEVLEDMEIQPSISDRHIWKFCASGDYSASSAYKALFHGSIGFEPTEGVEILGSPEMQILYLACGA